MKALILDTPLKISLIPRIFPQISDTIVLKLRNEITNEVLIPSISFTIGNYLEITINELVTYFEEGKKYEIEVTNNNETIYLGKLLTLKIGVNTQNYEYKDLTKKRFDYK